MNGRMPNQRPTHPDPNRIEEAAAGWTGGRGLDRDGQMHDRDQEWKRTDQEIEADIADRIADDDWIDGSHVEVSVASGVATIAGQVPDERMKPLVHALVTQVPGVVRVVDELA
jgi:osmotically-inducible protein OsmY